MPNGHHQNFDDVIFDFNGGLSIHHNVRFGTKYRRDDIHTYSFEVIWGCTREEMFERVHHFYHSPDHDLLVPLPGAIEALKSLSRQKRLS